MIELIIAAVVIFYPFLLLSSLAANAKESAGWNRSREEKEWERILRKNPSLRYSSSPLPQPKLYRGVRVDYLISGAAVLAALAFLTFAISISN